MKNHLSEEILDILNESPRWIVRLGATFMLFLLTLFLTGAWFIRYPEVLKGSAVVTSSLPTLKVVSEQQGRLLRLLVKNGTQVHEGDVLAEMENPTKFENTGVLRELLHQTRLFLQDNRRELNWPEDSLTWGALQPDVLRLYQHYRDFKRLQADVYTAQQVNGLKHQLKVMRQLQEVHHRKKVLLQQAFQNSFEAYQTDQRLFAEGIYSRTEYQEKENIFLAKKREQEADTENMIQNELKIASLSAQLIALEHNDQEQKQQSLSGIAEASKNLENGLQNWKNQYLITAPSDGQLVFLRDLNENQFVAAGELLFSILPAQQQYMALVELPVRGKGKVKTGQKVVLKLDDYPFQEFGTLQGQVMEMAPSAELKTCRIKVALTGGLISSYQRDFTSKSDLSGTAEIITEDLRLFERAFYGIRKLVM